MTGYAISKLIAPETETLLLIMNNKKYYELLCYIVNYYELI